MCKKAKKSYSEEGVILCFVESFILTVTILVWSQNKIVYWTYDELGTSAVIY